MSHGGRYALDPGARMRVVDGEGLVLRQRQAEVLGLNSSAALLVEKLAQGQAFEEACRALADVFAVDPERVRLDAEAFVATALAEGILVPVEESEP